MTRYYPAQHELSAPDRLERVHRDTYDRLYRIEENLAQYRALQLTQIKAAQATAAAAKATTSTTSTSSQSSVIDGGTP